MSSHGDIFPLPLTEACEPPPGGSLGRRAQQNVSRRRAHASAAHECVRSLNFAAGGMRKTPQGFGPRDPNPAQHSVLRRVWEATSERPSAHADMVPEAALRSLLRADPLYDIGSAGDVAPYSRDLVSLPFGQKAPVPLGQFLEGEALADISLPAERMLLGPEGLEGRLERGLIDSYMDPVLKHSVKKYSDFVGVLHSCGFVKFCQSAKVTNGLFFARKKSGKLRMILDARPANQLFRKAPTYRTEWERGIFRRASPGPQRATLHCAVRCQGLLLQIGYHGGARLVLWTPSSAKG